MKNELARLYGQSILNETLPEEFAEKVFNLFHVRISSMSEKEINICQEAQKACSTNEYNTLQEGAALGINHVRKIFEPEYYTEYES